jgi:hypothetical protein
MDGEPVATPNAELLETLACDIMARPKGAPHLGELDGALRGVRREPGALLVDFDASIAETLEAVVAAERQCCADIGWHVEHRAQPVGASAGSATIRLRIEASPEQLDALAPLFVRA